MNRKFSITSYCSFLIGLDQLNSNGPITDSQNIENPKADLISELSSILPESVSSSPHKDPVSKNNPPKIPYYSGTPIGNDASKLSEV